jgi:uncharacterized protein YcnI
MTRLIAFLAGLSAAAFASVADAHVTLEQATAIAGSYHKVVLQVPHGCKGSPTTAIRVRIPDGVAGAKPQPKAGWTLALKRTKLPRPIDAGHGRTVDEVVSEIAWSGGSLDDAEFDEFKVMLKLPDRPGTTLYLPVVQECREGVMRWIEVPSDAKPAARLEAPAPALRLVPVP